MGAFKAALHLLASHLALLEDAFSLGAKVGSHILNTDLSNWLKTRSAVVNRAVTYVLCKEQCKTLAKRNLYYYSARRLKKEKFVDEACIVSK